MNCLACIRQRYPTPVASDKKLADYILSQFDGTWYLSSQQLMAEAGVNQFSVVKFAQKLGFKGFPALKPALSEALTSSPDPYSVPAHNHTRGDDPLRLVGEKLIKDNVAAMHASPDVNIEEMLREAATLLRNARCMIAIGIGASGLAVRNFSWKLMKIGINTVSEQDMHALLATVQVMPSDDLLLAIFYFGERREVNTTAGEALHVGCEILAITGFSPNALQQQVTHCLYTIAEEQATRNAVISPISARMMLTDLPLMGLVRQDPGRMPGHTRHSEALTRKLV